MITSLEDDVRRRTRWVAGIVVTTALLGACSEKQEANDTLPSSSATSSSAELEPLGPADLPMPDEAREMTADGFNEFAEYYIDLINRLDDDLGTSAYLRQFSRSCETCERLASDAEADAEKGYTYAGGQITITARAAANIDGENAETAFTVEQSAYNVLDASGSPIPELSGQAASGLAAGMSGVWVDDHWIVTNLTFG